MMKVVVLIFAWAIIILWCMLIYRQEKSE